MAILGSSRSNAPSTIFHVPDGLASSLLWIPDDNVFQTFRLDFDSTLGPRNLIRLTAILIDGIGELPDIDTLPLFNFGSGPRFRRGLSLIEIVLAGERGDRHIIGRSPDIVVEESLKL